VPGTQELQKPARPRHEHRVGIHPFLLNRSAPLPDDRAQTFDINVVIFAGVSRCASPLHDELRQPQHLLKTRLSIQLQDFPQRKPPPMRAVFSLMRQMLEKKIGHDLAPASSEQRKRPIKVEHDMAHRAQIERTGGMNHGEHRGRQAEKLTAKQRTGKEGFHSPIACNLRAGGRRSVAAESRPCFPVHTPMKSGADRAAPSTVPLSGAANLCATRRISTAADANHGDFLNHGGAEGAETEKLTAKERRSERERE
jgi:hypothetical protein